MDNALFQECIEALHPNVKIYSQEKSDYLCEKFEQTVPLTKWARVEWEKIQLKAQIPEPKYILPALTHLLGKEPEQNIQIFWYDAYLPVIESSLNNVIDHLDDVVCVSFDTWLWSPSQNYIIEFFHEDSNPTIGIL